MTLAEIAEKIDEIFHRDDRLKTVLFKPFHVINNVQYPLPVVCTDVLSSTLDNTVMTYQLRTMVGIKLEHTDDDQIPYWDLAEQILVQGLTQLMFEMGMQFNITVNYFYEDYDDMLAGVYSDYTITVPKQVCY